MNLTIQPKTSIQNSQTNTPPAQEKSVNKTTTTYSRNVVTAQIPVGDYPSTFLPPSKTNGKFSESAVLPPKNKKSRNVTINSEVKSEADFLSKFKKPGDSYIIPAHDLAERRISNDNFKFHEMKPFLEQINKHLTDRLESASNTEEIDVLKEAISKTNELIENEIPYQDLLKHTIFITVLLDHLYFLTYIKPILPKDYVFPDSAYSTFCTLLENKEKSGSYDLYFVSPICKDFLLHNLTLPDKALHPQLRKGVNLEFRCSLYPNNLGINDACMYKTKIIYNDDYNLRSINNRWITLLPTTKSINYNSFNHILRSPLFPLKVSFKTEIVDGKIMTCLNNLEHDLIHTYQQTYAQCQRYATQLNALVPLSSSMDKHFLENSPYTKSQYSISAFFNRFDEITENLKQQDVKAKRESLISIFLLFFILHESLPGGQDPIPIFEIIKLTNKQLDNITEFMIKEVKNGIFPNMENKSVDAPDIIKSAKENIMMSVQAALGQGDRIGCTIMQK